MGDQEKFARAKVARALTEHKAAWALVGDVNRGYPTNQPVARVNLTQPGETSRQKIFATKRLLFITPALRGSRSTFVEIGVLTFVVKFLTLPSSG